MALNGKYIDPFEIVRNVLRDTGSTIDVPWQDAVEWVAEVMDLVGAPQAYRNSISSITINNYRGELPCDFESMIQCSGLTNGCRQFPMRESTNTFHPVFTCGKQLGDTSDNANLFAAGSELIDTNTPIGEDANGNPTFNFMNDTNVTLPKAVAGVVGTAGIVDESTYTLNDNFIFTSFKDTSKVLISYNARPISKETGFPLVPDNIKYKQAVQWYITMKIDYMLWRRGDITEAVFRYSEKESMWYIGAAGTIARTPSIDKMESWKNQMMHLIPKINRHSNFFKDLGSSERLIFGRKW